MKWYTLFIAISCIARSVTADGNTVEEFLRHLKPVKIDGPFDINLNEEQISLQGSVDTLVINGLSEFIVNRWFVDAANSKIEFDLSLAKLISTGHYIIDGILINFFPLQGSGNFNINVKDVRLTGHIQVERNAQNGIFVQEITFDTRFGELTSQLDNLGEQSDKDAMNEILGVVLVDLFYQHEKLIKSVLCESIKSGINQYLLANSMAHSLILGAVFPIEQDIPKPESRRDINGIVDKLFSNIRINATEGGWDPIRLPSDSAAFSITLFGATANGQVSVSNARLGGFSTIHRTGPCTLDIAALQKTAEAVVYVGGNDIELGVDIQWGFSVFNTNLQIELIVRHVDLMINVVVNTNTFEVVLQEFLLNEIGTVKITVGGIPGGGSDVISQRLSLISNLVKDSLIYAFQEALRPGVEELVTGPAISDFLAENLKF
ncbi:hypothetical protein GHT06_020644 [Daphnia sinensis]|uniref:Uncharacterized protein n=1 Tax=Daphnia sinensis TaxID=1820382 RepID=A0AAD5PQ54_9CRUS|nr:hypothetical protein GHT06_020644 [Daphnia sinensis]